MSFPWSKIRCCQWKEAFITYFNSITRDGTITTNLAKVFWKCRSTYGAYQNIWSGSLWNPDSWRQYQNQALSYLYRIWSMCFPELLVSRSNCLSWSCIIYRVLSEKRGKAAGASAERSGQSYDAQCPPGHTDAWCVAYHAGYAIGWNGAKTVG